MKINGRSISKAKLSDLINLSPETMAKMTKSETLAVTKRLHQAAKRRMKTIEKHGLSGFAESMAQRAYFGGDIPTLATAQNSRQKIQHQMVQLQSYLESQTSTYKGIKNVLEAEEKRIFQDAQGFKNDEERQRFWSAYMEFKRQNPTFFATRGGSTRIQQMIGKETFWRRRGFTSDDLSNLATKMLTSNTGGVDIRARAGRDFEV